MSFTPVVKKSIPTRTVTCIVWTCVLLGCTLSMHLLCPLYYEPNHWHIRALLLPWLPMVSIAIIMFGCVFGMGDASETHWAKDRCCRPCDQSARRSPPPLLFSGL